MIHARVKKGAMKNWKNSKTFFYARLGNVVCLCDYDDTYLHTGNNVAALAPAVR